jgi:hypothetical protein
MVKQKLYDQTINFIKKNSETIKILIPISVLLLNFSKSTYHILKLPMNFIDLLLKIIEFTSATSIINFGMIILIAYYLTQSLNSISKDIKKK